MTRNDVDFRKAVIENKRKAKSGRNSMENRVFSDKAALLKSAIVSEIEGFTYYDLLAREATNEEAVRRLRNLRDDEKRHREVLINLYSKHVGGKLGQLPEEGISPLARAFDAGKLKKFNSEIEYINLAIEAELAAVKFYKDGSKAIEDTEFSDILSSLADEENGHYEILMAEREAISGNYYWFSAEGTAPMED
jgi:rubrerythrin